MLRKIFQYFCTIQCFSAILIICSFRPLAFRGSSRGLTHWGHPERLQQGWDYSFLPLWFSTPTAPHHAYKAFQTSAAPDLLSQPGWPWQCRHPTGPEMGNQPLAWSWDAESRQNCLWVGQPLEPADHAGSMVTCKGHPKLWNPKDSGSFLPISAYYGTWRHRGLRPYGINFLLGGERWEVISSINTPQRIF